MIQVRYDRSPSWESCQVPIGSSSAAEPPTSHVRVSFPLFRFPKAKSPRGPSKRTRRAESAAATD